MADLAVVPITWSGSPVVGSGVSVVHCLPSDVDDLISIMRTFFTSIRTLCPDALQWSFPTAGDVINESTGVRTGTFTAASATAVSGLGGSIWVNGVGARVKWLTTGVVAGRTVVGSTFIVPLISGSYEGAGNITSTALGTLSTSAATVVAGTSKLRIYSRKTSSRPGVSFLATASQAPDKVSWLRSRRT